ncbi:MAG TPA: hypothetical protein VID29_04295 [Solirubrobacteraceae bacterium]|jgi:hypothetical protein
MPGHRTKTAAESARLLHPGTYLTDGNALFNMLGELPDEPSLCLLEDCRTYDVLVVHIDDLRSSSVREVRVRAAA